MILFASIILLSSAGAWLIFNADHLLKLSLHLSEYLASRINLWLKCALLSLVLDHAYLRQILVLSLQVVLLSIPKLGELSIYHAC